MSRRSAGLFLIVAFALCLAPSSSFIGGTRQMWAEHRLYLALAAPAIALAALFGACGRRGLVAGFCVALCLAGLTYRRNTDYGSALRLYADTVAKRPENPFAHANYGYALQQAGRADEALAQFERAIALKPDYGRAYFNAGVVLAQRGDLPAAIQAYDRARRFDPGNADIENNLGVALAQQGRIQEAEPHFAAAVRLRPDFADARDNLATARRQLGR